MQKNLKIYRVEQSYVETRQIVLGELSGSRLIIQIPEATYQAMTKVSRLSGQSINKYIKIHAGRIIENGCDRYPPLQLQKSQSNVKRGRFEHHG